MTIVDVVGIKISYSWQADHGAQKRKMTIYAKDGNDCVIDLVTPMDTPEFPVDVETPTVSPS